MEKHTKEELKQLAQGVFADDTKAACYYADENGTFLNEAQFESRSDEDKGAFVRIDNPEIKAEEVTEAPVEETEEAKEQEAAAEEEEPKKKSNSKKAKQ